MSETIWIALIVALITGTLSPILQTWLQNRSKRQERLEIEAREDAREARTQAALEMIKKQTDGVISQVTALAKSTGRLEGDATATKKAEETAATLLLGQQQGRDAERESISTKIKSDGDKPLPVADTRVAVSSERAADASEVLADATKRLADAAETKKE